MPSYRRNRLPASWSLSDRNVPWNWLETDLCGTQAQSSRLCYSWNCLLARQQQKWVALESSWEPRYLLCSWMLRAADAAKKKGESWHSVVNFFLLPGPSPGPARFALKSGTGTGSRASSHFGWMSAKLRLPISDVQFPEISNPGEKGKWRKANIWSSAIKIFLLPISRTQKRNTLKKIWHSNRVFPNESKFHSMHLLLRIEGLPCRHGNTKIWNRR